VFVGIASRQQQLQSNQGNKQCGSDQCSGCLRAYSAYSEQSAGGGAGHAVWCAKHEYLHMHVAAVMAADACSTQPAFAPAHSEHAPEPL
jgi:UTP-glucose-1-phosphate uridylyltransferase